MKVKARAALELMRPANIITAFADILAGFAAAGGVLALTSSGFDLEPDGVGWLLLATFGLYGGGIVFNDVFDASIDAEERPERAIPSGRISGLEASAMGIVLFLIAGFAALQVNTLALILTVAIALCTLIYNAWAKHSAVAGPLFMGLCRGGNFLLGGSLLPSGLAHIWYIALIPIIYISAITLISRGEVGGGSRLHGKMALYMIVFVLLLIPLFSLFQEFNFLISLPFYLLFAYMVLPPFKKASDSLMADDIRKAVKRGVVSLVIFNSVLAAGFAGWTAGVIVLLLFPLSAGVARLFSVT
ncbi:MAG TPA: UbiA-like protein EboC [Balneolaceae bacterium]|nr:UbiA-like protein EboC [Balneolaceae bacterium]